MLVKSTHRITFRFPSVPRNRPEHDVSHSWMQNKSFRPIFYVPYPPARVRSGYVYRSQTKYADLKRNETKRNESKRIETNRNETPLLTRHPTNSSLTAKQRLNELREAKAQPALKLRLSVEGGGCSGFQYKFALEDAAGGGGAAKEDDDDEEDSDDEDEDDIDQ